MIEERILSCIQNLTGANINVEDNVNLGVYGIDSLTRVQVVVALEDEFGIVFDNKDLTQDNFETIQNITRLLKAYVVE